jgi:hypothetical protein
VAANDRTPADARACLARWPCDDEPVRIEFDYGNLVRTKFRPCRSLIAGDDPQIPCSGDVRVYRRAGCRHPHYEQVGRDPKWLERRAHAARLIAEARSRIADTSLSIPSAEQLVRQSAKADAAIGFLPPTAAVSIILRRKRCVTN